MFYFRMSATDRYVYFAIVSYKIFVDYILVYYLKIIFWYHAKGYHLVLHRLCSKLTLHFILEGLVLVQCGSSEPRE